MAKKYLSLEEAAAHLGITPEQLNRYRERMDIRGFQDRTTWKFRLQDIEEFGRTLQADSTPDVPMLDEHPFFAPQKRWVLANCGIIDPTNIDEYIAYGGYRALVEVLTTMTAPQTCDLVEASGLRGRGGVGRARPGEGRAQGRGAARRRGPAARPDMGVW